MEGLRFSSAISLFCTLSSLVVCTFGLFIKSWWLNVQDSKTTYGLFAVIDCEDYLCTLNRESTEGWIIFTQVFVLIQFIMLITAVIFQTAGLVKKNLCLIIAASGALGWACGSSALQMIMLTQKYLKLTHAFQTTTLRPGNYVIYQTLPMGLCLTSGSICIPAFVCLVIYRTEERKLRLKQANRVV